MSGELLCHRTVERLSNDGAVEVIDFEIDVVRQDFRADHAAGDVNVFDYFFTNKMNTSMTQGRTDANWWLVIDEIAINHGFAVGVGEDGRAEDVSGVHG